MPHGFHPLIAAQFCSALADNALLIVAIAVLAERGLPAWWAPLLKLGFTLSYVVLAPAVGPLADAFPKRRLMAWANTLKIVGVLALLGGVHPVAAFVVVGLGAAAYAPAKYGLVTELVPGPRLVAANGWLEVSVVAAVLLGTGLGGLLVSPWWQTAAWPRAAAQALADAGLDTGQAAAIVLLLGIYGLAAVWNLAVPDSGARYPATDWRPFPLWRDFCASNRVLWRDPEGGLSLAVTTIFWGVGATLQFAVLRWAGEVLALPLAQSAWLQAVVAVGVVVGASAAGRWVPLGAARRMLGFGVALGLLMPVVAATTTVALAVPLLMGVGAVGGLLVVPLNALLQHRGCQLLSAGRSIAVQGGNENASVLVMLAVYAALLALELPILVVMTGFGLAIALAMALLMRRAARLVPAPVAAGDRLEMPPAV